MKKTEEIVSILKEDIELLLDKTNQLEDFKNAKISCASCNCIMDFENISAIQPYQNVDGDKKLKFHCNSNECLVNFKID